jgi:hypothetical protein
VRLFEILKKKSFFLKLKQTHPIAYDVTIVSAEIIFKVKKYY